MDYKKTNKLRGSRNGWGDDLAFATMVLLGFFVAYKLWPQATRVPAVRVDSCEVVTNSQRLVLAGPNAFQPYKLKGLPGATCIVVAEVSVDGGHTFPHKKPFDGDVGNITIRESETTPEGDEVWPYMIRWQSEHEVSERPDFETLRLRITAHQASK